MKLRSLLLIVIIVSTFPLQALNRPGIGLVYKKLHEPKFYSQLIPQSKEQKGIGIILNENIDFYPKDESMQLRLECALNEQAYPIITHPNILHRIVLSKPRILEKDQWLIKKCLDYILLIPYTYITSNESIDFMPKLALHDTTELERELGLKINHLESLNKDEFKSLTRKSEPNKYNTTNNNLIYALPKIFVTHKDKSRIEWIIEIAGHGGERLSERLVEKPTPFSVIADFSLQEFKKVIDFFAASLSIRVLLVASCGIGKNIAQQVFTSENLNQMVQHTYPFDIIFFALGEEPTFLYVDLCQKGSFSKFIEKLKAEKGTPDYYSLLFETFLPSTITANPVPQIRYKNTEYFLPAVSIRAKKKNTIVISEVMASTRKQPLLIPNHSEIKNIILYAPAIPFPIDTGSNSIHWYFKFKPTQPLLSNPNNDNIIHFASLNINNRNLEEFLRNWPQLKEKKLVVYADKFRFSVGISLKDAIITPEYIMGIIILSNGHKHIMKLEKKQEYFNLSSITPVDPTKIKQDYVVEFEHMYGKIPEFPQQIAIKK